MTCRKHFPVLSSFMTYHIIVFVSRLTRRMPLVEQDLLTLPDHPSSSPVFSGIRVTRSLVLCVCCGIRVTRSLVLCVCCGIRVTRSLVLCVCCGIRVTRSLVLCVCCGVHVTRSLVLCVMLCRSLFVLLSFFF